MLVSFKDFRNVEISLCESFTSGKESMRGTDECKGKESGTLVEGERESIFLTLSIVMFSTLLFSTLMTS